MKKENLLQAKIKYLYIIIFYFIVFQIKIFNVSHLYFLIRILLSEFYCYYFVFRCQHARVQILITFLRE